MPIKKRAGCTSYASVDNDFLLYNKAVTTPVKTGGTTGRVLKKNGGNIKDLPLPASVINLANSFTNPKNGGCGCASSGMRKGGAVELAPFAAALAFLAARMSVDDKLNFNKLLGIKRSSTSSSSRSKKA